MRKDIEKRHQRFCAETGHQQNKENKKKNIENAFCKKKTKKKQVLENRNEMRSICDMFFDLFVSYFRF